MTKLKSKKLSKSTIAIILMAIAMVAILSFGATFALFSAATEKSTTTITTGKISLTSNSSLTFKSSNLLPGDDLITAGSISVTPNTGSDKDALGEYVACKFTITAEGADAQNTPLDASAFSITWNTEGGHWVESGSSTNIFVWAPSTSTSASAVSQPISAQTTAISQIHFDVNDIWLEDNNESGYTSEGKWMGAEISITIEFRAVQVTNNQNGTDTKTMKTISEVASLLFGTGSGTIDAAIETARTPQQTQP